MSKSPNSDNVNTRSENNQSDSDNPFVRFRHFADEQVGSLLQGFVGLPSAFAKPQSGSQWSVFDEDLKRRDELQARRRELKEAEEARSGNRTTSEDVEVQIPVKKSQPSHSQVDFDHYLPDRRMNVFGSYDIPLYSPLLSQMATPFSDDLRHTMSYFAAMMLYKAGPSDISLVPYLLGSPYSPLILSLGQSIYAHNKFIDKQSRSPRKYGDTPGAIPRDDFPYCEAFEDLILTSQAKSNPDHGLASITSKVSGNINSTIENGSEWIGRLRRLGILHLSNSDLSSTSKESHSPGQQSDTSSQDVASSLSWARGSKRNAETEEQLYENFLTNASTTPDQFFTTLESTLTAVEQLIKSKNMTFEESRRASPSNAQEAEISQKSTSEPTESKREVSSSSTVEHYISEDGSVETTIRVWKRFDDGSETETTSSHTFDKATRQRDIARSDFNFEESVSSQQRVETDDQENESRTKKNTKSGWFWN